MSERASVWTTRILQKFLQVLASINSNCVLEIDKKGLRIVSVDDNYRCVGEAFVSQRAFSKWRISSRLSMNINLDFLKKVLSSNASIEEVRQTVKSGIEVLFGEPIRMTLTIRGNVEDHSKNTEFLQIPIGAIIFDTMIRSHELGLFLKTVGQACDEIGFQVDSRGLISSTNFLNFTTLKLLSSEVRKWDTRVLRFSVPMRYLSALLPVLNFTDSLRLCLTNRDIVIVLLQFGRKYKLKLFISSRIE
jgi:hypothetical protein